MTLNVVNINFCNEIHFEKGNNTGCASNFRLLSSQLLLFALSSTILKIVCHSLSQSQMLMTYVYILHGTVENFFFWLSGSGPVLLQTKFSWLTLKC